MIKETLVVVCITLSEVCAIIAPFTFLFCELRVAGATIAGIFALKSLAKLIVSL